MLNKIVKCKVLKEDFFPGINYISYRNCPITKAIQRVDIDGEHIGGVEIYKKGIDVLREKPIAKIKDASFSTNVLRMCEYANGYISTGIEPKNIEFEVELTL
jgi:hypothetical protein